MDYEDAIEATVTRAEAIKELYAHGTPACEIALFYEEVGYKDEYKGSEVLNWLGY